MISSTTLILATLVFNAASILGAPIRIPSTAPEVEVRTPVAQPAIPKVAVVETVPVYKRSAEGTATRPRLARETVPEHESRDTASESVEMRDSLPEVEKIVRRYPRRHLAEFYEKRSPDPSPAPDAPSAPSSQAEARSEPAPPVERRFPRRALFERHAQRSTESAPPIEARNEYDPEGHFVREHNPELMAKREALPTDDNVPREPEPAPAPAPVPEPAPNPAPAEQSEKVRRFPRRVYAEYYSKRQDTQDPPKPVESSTATSTSTSTSSSSSPTATTTTTSTPSSAAGGLPATLEKAIADAIVKGTSNPVTNVGTDAAGKKSTYSDTTITIKITHQANSDVTTPEKPKGSSTSGNPPPISSPSATATSTATGSAPSSTSTAAGDAPKPTATGSSTGAGGDSEDKPKEETDKPKPSATAEGNAPASSGTPEGDSAEQPAETRDLDSDATAKPITKRKLGLSGALWASWSRRNIPQ